MDRSDDPNKHGLGYKAPGDVFEVTQALGRGFASLFTSYVGLLSALEVCLPLEEQMLDVRTLTGEERAADDLPRIHRHGTDAFRSELVSRHGLGNNTTDFGRTHGSQSDICCLFDRVG